MRLGLRWAFPPRGAYGTHGRRWGPSVSAVEGWWLGLQRAGHAGVIAVSHNLVDDTPTVRAVWAMPLRALLDADHQSFGPDEIAKIVAGFEAASYGAKPDQTGRPGNPGSRQNRIRGGQAG